MILITKTIYKIKAKITGSKKKKKGFKTNKLSIFNIFLTSCFAFLFFN